MFAFNGLKIYHWPVLYGLILMWRIEAMMISFQLMQDQYGAGDQRQPCIIFKWDAEAVRISGICLRHHGTKHLSSIMKW